MKKRGEITGWYSLVVATLAVAPLCILVLLSVDDRIRSHARHLKKASEELMPDEERCQPGPWGKDLRCIRLVTTTPAAFLAPEQLMRTYARGWLLPDARRDNVQMTLAAHGLRPEVVQMFLSFEAEDTPTGLRVHPAPERIWSLLPADRAVLYSLLATCPENIWQCYPVVIEAGRVDAGLAASGLAPATKQKFKRLLYSYEELECFADTPLLLSQLHNSADRIRALQVISSQPFLRLESVVLPEEDYHRKADYWSRGMAAKDVIPLLSALARNSGSYRLDAIHLLPPLARERFSTWTTSHPRTGKHLEQSFVMALNFFEQNVAEGQVNPSQFLSALDRYYHPPAGGMAFGDIVVFRSEDAKVLHCCTFVADNVTFGRRPGPLPSAWGLTSLEDLELALAVHRPLTTEIYRRRQL